MGCHFHLQGIFLTQGSNPVLPHCRQTLYCLSHQGSPRYHCYPPPGDLPNPGIKPMSPTWQADSLPSEPASGLSFWGTEMNTINIPCSLDGKESALNAGDLGSIPGSGRSPGDGNGNPLQYSCLDKASGSRSLALSSCSGNGGCYLLNRVAGLDAPLRFLPPFEMRPSSIAPNPVE